MTNIMFIFLFFIVITFYLIYKTLDKINYDLNGYEIILYQLSCLFLYHIGNYYKINIYQEVITSFLLLVLAYYYIIRMIKTKKYIQFTIILLYLLSTIANGFSIEFIQTDGWGGLGYLLYTIFLGIGIILFTLLINLITLIIRNVKKITIKNISIFKNELKTIILVIFIIIPYMYGYVGDKYYDQLDKKRREEASIVALNYLKTKYPNGKFELKRAENCDLYDCDGDRYYIYFNSSYLTEEFFVEINKDDLTVYEDNLLYSYISYILNEDIYDSYDLANYYRYQMNSIDTIEGFSVTTDELEFDREKFDNTKFEELPTEVELQKFVTLKEPRIFITKEYNQNDIELFKKDIVTVINDIYEENVIVDESGIVRFEFAKDNPFNNSTHYYDDSGYIKDVKTKYLLYTQATPFDVEKKERNLIFSAKGLIECESVELKVYSDNTYKYFKGYKYNKKNIEYGEYNYNLDELTEDYTTDSNENIIYSIKKDNKEYFITDKNKKFDEFLKSIDISLHECIDYD